MAGKITALKPQSKRKNRVNVFLDGGFAFGLMKSLAEKLAINQFLTDQDIQDLKTKEAEKKLYQRAVKFLAVRPRSEAELRRSFQKRREPQEIQETVLNRLVEVGLVDDQAFAETWVENRLEFRPRGRRALRAELLQKGISRQIISETLANLDEEEAALRAAEKGAKRYQHLEYKEYKRKLLGYLSRRGFPFDIIYQMIDRFKPGQIDPDQEREETK